MKTITRISILIFFMTIVFACKKDNTTDVTPATPDYQLAIEAKYKALGWDKDGHSPFNGSGIIKTAGGKGYVQYYAFGTLKNAIYYYEGKGAFGMYAEEMNKYDALGQDKWGIVVSDPKATKAIGGCGYNDIIRNDGSEGIITCQNLVDGDVYAKYKALNRWDGPLGLPVKSVLLSTTYNTNKGVYGSFEKGAIWYSPTTGAGAIWGKTLTLYASVDYERSWLGYPKESCDPNKGDANQRVSFQNGSIGVGNDGKCGNYYDATGLSASQTGKTGGTIPCY